MIRDVQMSSEKVFLVMDIQMSLGSSPWKGMFRCPSLLVTQSHWGHLNITYHKLLGTSEHPLSQTPRGHLNIPYLEVLGTSGHLTVRTGHPDTQTGKSEHLIARTEREI